MSTYILLLDTNLHYVIIIGNDVVLCWNNKVNTKNRIAIIIII